MVLLDGNLHILHDHSFVKLITRIKEMKSERILECRHSIEIRITINNNTIL